MARAERLVYIDCLRGVAICAVVLVHTGQLIGGLAPWLKSLTDYGGKGVELFFLLSALVLVSIYTNQRVHAAAFFTKRFFRIAPMFYFGMLLYLLLNGTGPSAMAPNGIGLHQVVLTALFLHGWAFYSINSVVPGGWSIADEAMFYILFPFLLLLLNTWRRAAMALLVTLVISRLSFVFIPQIFAGLAPADLLHLFASFCFTTQLPAFICGFVTYFLIRELETYPDHLLKRNTWSFCFFMIVLFMCIAASGSKMLTNYLLADLLFILLVAGVYVSQLPLIVNPLLKQIGLISYSIYIVHFAVVKLFALYIVPALPSHAPAGKLTIVYIGVMALSIAIATLTHELIEQPMIRLGKRIAARL